MNKLQRPEGTRDYLPDLAKKKSYVEQQVEKVFKKWGYQEIITPTFEFYDVLSTATEGLQAKMYKFFNRNGEILALRPEMTAPIGRLVATELREEPLPLRLSYQGNVYRYETPRAGRHREFYQAGIELLGVDNPIGDAEVISIAVKAVENAGLDNFKIDIGDVGYFTGIMKEAKLDEELQIEIRHALSERNFVKLEELITNTELSAQQQEAILAAMDLRGGAEVIAEAKSLVNNEESLEALINLEEVYQNLQLMGVADYIYIDLSIVRSFDYYTGIVFEGYNKDLGYTICGGGRYDNLVKKFGYPATATGFAVGIDRLILSLERQGYDFDLGEDKVLLRIEANQKEIAFDFAEELREQGTKVELELATKKLEETINYAKEKGIAKVLILETNCADVDYEVQEIEVEVGENNG
ncbi:MAG: ATP phosphoribosyltransferase regulatory subunit [Bacillota bacterium]